MLCRRSAGPQRLHFAADKHSTFKQPSYAEASEGILLRGLAGFNPAKRLGAKQDGGGGRTRTFEAMRRLIYSQLPLPLGTLPRLDAHRNPKSRDLAMSDQPLRREDRGDPVTGARSRARLWAKRQGKVNQRDQPIGMLLPLKLP